MRALCAPGLGAIKKVKNGSLTVADLVAEERQRLATLGNGGDGDCLWQSAASTIPGIG